MLLRIGGLLLVVEWGRLPVIILTKVPSEYFVSGFLSVANELMQTF